MQSRKLTPAQKREFEQNGLLVLSRFYDLESEIEPIQRAIYDIIGVLIEKHHLSIDRPPFDASRFDAGFQELITFDRRIGGEVYDAVKQIPAFIRLVACEKNEALMRDLRGSRLVGVAGGGYGIRIDNPHEERYRAPWHQEYPAQLRSLDGLVLWSPLVPITQEIGPVEFCIGSHKHGPARVYTRDPRNPDKTGAYGLILENEESLLARYQHVAPLTNPGDLVVVDFLTLHASGHNAGIRSRWSMQLRYFNFLDSTGIRIGWRGSYASGADFSVIHPELIADRS